MDADRPQLSVSLWIGLWICKFIFLPQIAISIFIALHEDILIVHINVMAKPNLLFMILLKTFMLAKHGQKYSFRSHGKRFSEFKLLK